MINGMTIDGKAVKEISIDGKLWWQAHSPAIVFADPEVERVLLTTWVLVDYVDQSNPGSLGYVDRNGDGKISFDEAASCGSLLSSEKSTTSIISFNKVIKSFNEFKWFKGLGMLNNMFLQCLSLKAVEIPEPDINRTTELGSGMFRQCTSLISVIIPEGWETLGNDFARQCASLILIDIPSTCKSIGSNLLTLSMTAGSPHTTIVCRAETPPSFGGYGSGGEPLEVYVPDQSVQAYRAASGWNAYPNAIKPLTAYI